MHLLQDIVISIYDTHRATFEDCFMILICFYEKVINGIVILPNERFRKLTQIRVFSFIDVHYF